MKPENVTCPECYGPMTSRANRSTGERFWGCNEVSPMTIIGLDPGPTHSALVLFDGQRISHHEIEKNDKILLRLNALKGAVEMLVIEQIASMGMAVGADVFETCFWSGRFAEAFDPFEWRRLKRHEIKMHLCGSMRAKDTNIRQALIDRFGGSAAVGKKATPGPLYGLKGDEWSALAVAVTWADLHKEGEHDEPL